MIVNFKFKKKNWILLIFLLLCILTIVRIVIFVVFYLNDSGDNMISGKFAPVNHAVKDRCILKKNGCPKSATDLSGLDQNFAGLLSGNRVWYEYNQEKQYYTLVIASKLNYAVVFDSRMSTSKNEEGIPFWDFKDFYVTNGCKLEEYQYRSSDDNFETQKKHLEFIKLPSEGIFNRLCELKPTVF